jgi:hypothetical protein
MRDPRVSGLRPAVIAMALAAAIGLTGCSGRAANGTPSSGSPPPTAAARPSSTAKLAILSPTNGQVVRGSEVKLKLSLKGARIVPATTTHIVPDQGHVHVFLDGNIVSMTFGLDQTIPTVTPGQHTLRIEFVASDHLPFDPRVISEVVFEVKA